MSTCIHARASYNRVNPNLRVGKRSQPVAPKPVHDTFVRVFVPSCARPVSSFKLTMAACVQLSQVTDTDLSPFQIHARLISGKPFKSVWNNQPAIIKL
jgi:hypothetical protein